MQVTTWFNKELFTVVGWTMIHSLWQCLGLLALQKLLLGFADLRRSALRYAMSLGVLALAAVVVMVTFCWEWRRLMGGSGLPGIPAEMGALVPMLVGGVDAKGPVYSLLEQCCPWLAFGWLMGMTFYIGRLLYSGFVLRGLRRSPGLAVPGVDSRRWIRWI
jgi:hypothetical protein